MKPAIILICILFVSGLVLYILDRLHHNTDDDSETPPAAAANSESECTADCCSLNEVCPSEKILMSINKELLYFNDEELDSFKGRTPDGYTDDEIEQFRDVLYTLRDDELLAWQKSVKKRGITLPATINDECIMLYNETTPPPAHAIKDKNQR